MEAAHTENFKDAIQILESVKDVFGKMNDYESYFELELAIRKIKAPRKPQNKSDEDLRLEEKDKQLAQEIRNQLQADEDISVSVIQRRFKQGYFAATRAFNRLLAEGFIEIGKDYPYGNSKVKSV